MRPGLREAEQLLEAPQHYAGFAVRKSARPVLRLWRYPAFDPMAAWALMGDEDAHVVRRVVCSPVTEAIAGTDSFEVRYDTFGTEAVLPTETVDALVSKLTEIAMPPSVHRHPAGLDGCTYGIMWSRPGEEVRLTWWGRSPQDWALLRLWYARAVTTFEDHLADCGVQIQSRHPWVE